MVRISRVKRFCMHNRLTAFEAERRRINRGRETVYFSTFRGNERWIGEDKLVVGIG